MPGGHAEYDLIYPYLALVNDGDAEESLPPLASVQLASLWVADQAQGRLPPWFVEGAGMAAAARLHKNAPMVQGWRSQLPPAVASLTQPDAFMTGKLPPASRTTVAFGFVDALLQKHANFHRLVEAATQTDDFDAACQRVRPSGRPKNWQNSGSPPSDADAKISQSWHDRSAVELRHCSARYFPLGRSSTLRSRQRWTARFRRYRLLNSGYSPCCRCWWWWRLSIAGVCSIWTPIYASLRMLVQLIAVGYVLKGLFLTESPLLVSTVITGMVLIAGWMCCVPSERKA